MIDIYGVCVHCEHMKTFHSDLHGCLVPMGSDGVQEFYCNCTRKFVPDFVAQQKLWMSNNDPNTWAWLMARDKRGEKFSEAVRGANEMRYLAFAKRTYYTPTNEIAGEGRWSHDSFMAAWASEVLYGCPAWNDRKVI